MRKILRIAGVVVLCVVVILWSFPRWVTGDYSRVTIDRVEKHADGQVDFYLSSVTSAGSILSEEFYTNDHYMGGGSSSGRTFPARPTHGMSMDTSNLFPERTKGTPQAIAAVRDKRLLVMPGTTYLIRPGRPLLLFDFATSSGDRHIGRVAIYPR